MRASGVLRYIGRHSRVADRSTCAQWHASRLAASPQQQCRRKRAAPLASRAASQPQSDAAAASATAPDVLKAQAGTFEKPEVVQEFIQPLPEDVEQRLAQIIAAVPDLGPHSRVLDVGSGTGCLIPHLQSRGVQDVTAVDLSEPMLQQLRKRFPAPGLCGNDPGVRTWTGDFLQAPPYLGPADAILMNAVFGNFYSLREALLKAAMMLVPGGYLVISHPMGRSWHTQLHKDSPHMVPHQLPDQRQLRQLTRDMPLQLLQYRDDPELYLALLQVPPGYQLPGGPLTMESTVVTGFGRGSRQLGVPTANMDPEPLQEQLQQLPQGVYFGWAQVDGPEGWPAVDSDVHKMVMNVGRRPTVNEGDEAATVEVHILHSYSHEEFYGAAIRVAIHGFIRPEIKFTGLQQLLARIKTDIGIAKSQLDEAAAAALRGHNIFRKQL
eukprot:GHUV01002536.1.p1 GENE.GHUV01002536.1~~GHUV01002536.1.p1  ORF type:complete len:437 (+),score=125.17 GHUV01002536.1:127-1437(+)